MRDAATEVRNGLDLGRLAEHPGFLLRLAQQRVFEAFHARIGGLGLTPARYSVLAVLAANPGARQGEVARALEIKPSNFAVLANAMREDGLVEVEPDPADRRASPLRLTREGAALLRRAAPAVAALERSLQTGVDPARWAVFIDVLRALRRPHP